MTDEDWKLANFPHFSLPTEIKPSVHTQVWEEKMANLTDRSIEHAATPLLRAVLTQLQHGADSGVEPPGTDITKCKIHKTASRWRTP